MTCRAFGGFVRPDGEGPGRAALVWPGVAMARTVNVAQSHLVATRHLDVDADRGKGEIVAEGEVLRAASSERRRIRRARVEAAPVFPLDLREPARMIGGARGSRSRIRISSGLRPRLRTLSRIVPADSAKPPSIRICPRSW